MSASLVTQPARLLLATDLSARCDRALDRAAQLAEEWHAELIALNVLDIAASPDQALAWATGANDDQVFNIARRQLARDLSGLHIHATMRMARAGDAAAAIRDVAARTDSGLVVTGVACNEVLGRFLLGSTVERLARTLPQPLLVVRNRARSPYRRVVVATDFSDSSRHALLAAARLLPGRELILYHAYQSPSSGISNNLPHVHLSREIEQGEYADFLAASKLPADVTVRPAIEHGALEISLTRYVRNHEIELVLMGTHGRSGVMSILLGSSATNLLNWLPCDVLVVREPRAIT
ncbi:MAG: universal stress protein [Betaproteobacteria bacterium]|nr:universal stress protein [Betaproteobacteria bacterium]